MKSRYFVHGPNHNEVQEWRNASELWRYVVVGPFPPYTRREPLAIFRFRSEAELFAKAMNALADATDDAHPGTE